ncbi:chemotaxis protein CheX [Natronospora cellulosivora (SeqCode)]
MNVEYINPVYQATYQVFERMFQIDVVQGKLKVEEDIIPTKEINAIIGVSGELNGTILFSFSTKMVLEMVEEMAGMEIKEVDKFAASAIGELANIISGNAMSVYAEEGYECDIIPPQINMGKTRTYSTATDKALVIPLTTDYGEFELYLSIAKKTD